MVCSPIICSKTDWLTNCWRVRCGGSQRRSLGLGLTKHLIHDLLLRWRIWTFILKGTFHLHWLERLNWAAKETGKRSFKSRIQRFPFVSIRGVNRKANSCTAQHRCCLFNCFFLSCCVSRQWRARPCGMRSVNSSPPTFCYIHSQAYWVGPLPRWQVCCGLLWKPSGNFFKGCRVQGMSHSKWDLFFPKQ